jgi:hypothetical protein
MARRSLPARGAPVVAAPGGPPALVHGAWVLLHVPRCCYKKTTLRPTSGQDGRKEEADAVSQEEGIAGCSNPSSSSLQDTDM